MSETYITWASISQRGSPIFHFKGSQNQRLQRRLEVARRQGKGLVVADWQLPADGGVSVNELAENLIAWCKETLAGSRRPYGVDHFDLVLALRSDEGTSNLSFSRLRPGQLYDEAFNDEISLALRRKLAQADALAVHLAAGLFSWGDALHAALASEPAASG